MKTYRVRCSNGNVEIIEAESMEAAVSLARKKFGKLPNEINKEISVEIINYIIFVALVKIQCRRKKQ